MAELRFEDWLPQILNLYYKQKLSTKLVALTLGISKTSVKRILKRTGYTLRTPSQAMELAYKEGRASLSTFGRDKNPNWRKDTSRRQKHYLSEHPHQFSGRQHTEEAKIKMSLTRLNRHPSSETRGKMSKISKARFADPRNHPLYGKYLSKETKRRMSEAHQGKTPSSETKQRMSEARKLCWQDPEYRAKVVPACLRSRRPTDLEAKVITIIDKYSLPYKYTGDGSFKIGNLFPDFVNINGDKVAIEVFGGHWHQNMREPLRNEEVRKAILKEYGWKLIVIWGDEIKTMPEEAILEKIREVK